MIDWLGLCYRWNVLLYAWVVAFAVSHSFFLTFLFWSGKITRKSGTVLDILNFYKTTFPLLHFMCIRYFCVHTRWEVHLILSVFSSSDPKGNKVNYCKYRKKGATKGDPQTVVLCNRTNFCFRHKHKSRSPKFCTQPHVSADLTDPFCSCHVLHLWVYSSHPSLSSVDFLGSIMGQGI